MVRVFHPIAWYVDARWHKNQFVLAAYCIVAAMLSMGAQLLIDAMVLPKLFHGWMLVIIFGAVGANLLPYQGTLRGYIAAAKWQEDHPGKMCWPHHYPVMFPGELRFAQMVLSVLIFLILWLSTRSIGAALPGVWLLFITFAECALPVCCRRCCAVAEKKAYGAEFDRQS